MQAVGSSRGTPSWNSVIRYGPAVALPLAATALKVALAAIIVPTYILAYPAVMLVATLGGLGPGLVATGASAILAWYWLIPPRGFNALDLPDATGLALFLGMGVFMTVVADGLRRSRDRVAQLERDRALLVAEAKFRAYVEAAPEALFVVDGQGRYLDWNPAALEMIGVDAATLDSMTIADLHDKADLEAALRDFTTLTVKGRLERDYQLVRPDGRKVWVTLRAVKLAEGRYLAFCQDITERKRAEAERERLSMAMEQAAESVVITDRQGAIEYVNPAFESVSGYSRAEVLGQNPRILKSGVQDETFYRSLWETISDGKTWRGRLVNKRKDGRQFTEEATISPVRNTAGIITSYVAVKRDITRHLALEAQLLQSQKMEGIGRLAGGIAHDFNNILSVILSSAGFALRDLPEGSPLREDIQEIEKAGERAAALTRQLLAFSRKQMMQPVPLDLNQVLAGMEVMLRRVIGEDIDLVKVLSPDIGLVKADRGQIEQVIMNLAVNSRDAMPEGGELTLETGNVNLDAAYAGRHAGSVPGPHVMVAVTDSGIGMGERTMERLFEPFFTTKGLGKGSGLGLSTVYGIVKQSGGSIYVYSEVGHGTTFKFYLPRIASDLLLGATSPSSRTRTVGWETVLVVEDDEAVRQVAKRILCGAGYTVLTAENGAAALLMCEKHPAEIHLVLTDVVMPEMSGKVLGDRLTMVRPGTPVLYMSGYTDNAIVHQGVLDPGTKFIGKPITQGELLRMVRFVLDGDGAKG